MKPMDKFNPKLYILSNNLHTNVILKKKENKIQIGNILSVEC